MNASIYERMLSEVLGHCRSALVAPVEPTGWQKLYGGRSAPGGNDHRYKNGNSHRTPGRGCQMQTKASVLICYATLALSALFLLTTALTAADTNTPREGAPFDAPQYDWILSSHQHGSGYHWPGNTNALILKLSWFLFPQGVFSCDVLADGQASG